MHGALSLEGDKRARRRQIPAGEQVRFAPLLDQSPLRLAQLPPEPPRAARALAVDGAGYIELLLQGGDRRFEGGQLYELAQ